MSAMAELFVVNGVRGGTLFPLPTAKVTRVGRLPTCDISIPDAWVSSEHATFEWREGKCTIRDLGSSNGTFLDDVRIENAVLEPGAKLRFGKTELEFRDSVRSHSGAGLLKREGTVMRSIADMQAELTRANTAFRPDKTLGGAKETITPEHKSARHVAALNELGRALIEASDLDSSLAAILKTVVRIVQAERSCLLLMNEKGALVPMAYAPAGTPPQLSGSVIETAIQVALANRAGLLVQDALHDRRFNPSQSIVSQNIRSCLCVPVWGDNRILGMLVLDRNLVQPFTEDDLELVTAVGYQAALAIDRARFLEQVRQAEEQRKKLLRHFSPDVANLILSREQSQGDPLEVTLREDVTVLFSDVQGFTSMTERLPPLELGILLKEYFREMTEILFEQGGTLDKFIGDGLMAVFGAPVEMKDGAERAVRCAMRMLERLSELNLRVAPDRNITIRIGINTGKALAGNFGSPERMEFTVLGDAVNVASRLESMALPGTVLVGRSTYELARNAFRFKPLGEKQVKGKSLMVDCYQLLGPV